MTAGRNRQTENDKMRRKRTRDGTSDDVATAWQARSLPGENYKYAALTSKTAIRILTLLPGAKLSRINCLLSVVELDQAPPYNALSYAWGRQTDTRLISCPGKRLKVSVSLRDALENV